MNQWNFVLAAYAIMVAGTALLLVTAWLAMRRAEAAAEAVRRR